MMRSLRRPFFLGLIALAMIAVELEKQAFASEECQALAFDNQNQAEIDPALQVLFQKALKSRRQSDIDDLVWLGLPIKALSGTPFYRSARQTRLNVQLVESSARGDNTSVLSALTQGANVNTIPNTDQYLPAIVSAARCGHLSTVKLLAEHGADVNVVGQYYVDIGTWRHVTALWWAHAYNFVELEKFLVRHGAKVVQPILQGLQHPR